MLRRAIIAVLILLMTCYISWAVNSNPTTQPEQLWVKGELFKISYDFLRGKNYDPESFYTSTITDSLIVAYDKVREPKLLAEHKRMRLWIFKFNDSAEWSVHTMYLPVETVEQVAVSPDDRYIYILGQDRLTLLRVDTSNYKFEVIWKPELNKPGFRFSGVMWYSLDGRLLATGYFYDEKQVGGDDVLIEINPSQKGMAIFSKPILNLRETIYRYSKVSGYMIADENNLIITRVLRKPYAELINYHNGSYKVLARGIMGNSTIAWNGRVLYTRYQPDRKAYQLVVYDPNTNERWTQDSDVPLVYPFLSEDGKVGVVAFMDLKEFKAIYYYVNEKDGYKLHPFLKGVKPGAFKLSRSGKHWLMLSPEYGVIVGKFNI